MGNRIFTFWEPKTRLTPYLKLCRETWEVNLCADEIVELDYSNLQDYLGNDVFDLNLLKQIPLMLQKDAIMVALLKKHGGVFLDMDTIAVRNIKPLLQKLEQSEVVMFNAHLAFIAARPNSRLLTLWHSGIKDKLQSLGTSTTSRQDLKWNYLGNSELTKAKSTMLKQARLLGPPLRFVDRCSQFARKLIGSEGTWSCISQALDRVNQVIHTRSERLAFATIYRKKITMLDRDKFGFIAESRYRSHYRLDPHQAYLDFWFEHDVNPQKVFCNNQMIIGLHNSWTPDWYKSLSREEVLSHGCLLSRTLRHVLGRNEPAFNYNP